MNGQTQESVSDFDKALSINPTFAPALKNRVAANFQLKQWSRVITDVALLTALDKSGPEEISDAGLAKWQLRNFEGAVADMTAAIVKDGKNPIYLRQRGDFLFEMKQRDKACADWRKAAALGDTTSKNAVESRCKN